MENIHELHGNITHPVKQYVAASKHGTTHPLPKYLAFLKNWKSPWQWRDNIVAKLKNSRSKCPASSRVIPAQKSFEFG